MVDFTEHKAAFRMLSGDVRDPYPSWARQRQQAAVSVISMPTGTDDGAVAATFAVHRYAEAAQALRETKVFSSSVHGEVMGPVFGRSILEMDAPDHTRYRSLVSQAFRPKALQRWRDELIQPLLDDLVGRFQPRGEADLVRELTFAFPAGVTAALLGVPAGDVEQFQEWAFKVTQVMAGLDESIAAADEVRAYFAPILEQRRAHPEGDLLSELVSAELDGERLTDEEIFPFILLLSPAGSETTYCATGNLLYGLLTQPEQLKALQADRGLVRQAVEEALRWEPPLTFVPRVAAADTELGGVEIPSGSRLAVMLGSANRDESRWEQPDAFDIHRPPQPHLAFAFGPHQCLGIHLARMEMELALATVLDRLPGLQLDPDATDVHIHGYVFRTPETLPVRFDPGG